jgi:hypothetical protein
MFRPREACVRGEDRPSEVETEMPSGFCVHARRLSPHMQSARYFAVTLDVMDAITFDAVLNWSGRFSMPCRRAIQAKSV